MRPHPRSKKRYWRDRNRVPGRWPRIRIGVFVKRAPINFKRYNKNPVLLENHAWHSEPIGYMKDIRIENRDILTALPVFHKHTTASRTFSKLHRRGMVEGGIGGYKRKDGQPFELVEISLIPKPSKPCGRTK